MLVWEIDDQIDDSLVAESAGSVTSHSVTQEAVSKSQHLDSKAPIVSQGDWLGSLSLTLTALLISASTQSGVSSKKLTNWRQNTSRTQHYLFRTQLILRIVLIFIACEV